MMFRTACGEALGAPALAMSATFLAFGAAVQTAGLGLGWALAAALLVYGMPGQMVLVAAIGTPGGALPSVLGAVTANARFLPMAVALSPWLGAGPRRWWALPFIAVTPWAMAMRRLPLLPPGSRLAWFMGFGLTSWLVAGCATILGHAVAPLLQGGVLAALLFVNPLYFALILAGEMRSAPARRAVLGGVCAAPLALFLPAAWALLGAGLLGGTLAFLWGEWRGRR
ncbi:AzlC family ABC transporter permease [Sediminicoccus sp. KRV36]|uniref:AzlC family ABC transporter permease n=1 Tax=Sediminicoccus sp. KRV36 TaxID=3133721 RepID=UPI00200D4592|nr:AzlC family ABC transporter permease [Sediminicoccus rosea]UPY37790.1 AzlC family ABC transporter permease [Sediminicoccus rosea]